MLKRFDDETIFELRDWLVAQTAALGEGGVVCFAVPDPDGIDGEARLAQGGQGRRRSYKSWVDLAELCGCRMLTPRVLDGPGDAGYVELRFAPLKEPAAFHRASAGDPREKYGTGSAFARLDKFEQPAIALALEAALRRVDLPPGSSLLDLGVNDGEELALIERVYGTTRFATLRVVGVDHSVSAIGRARARFAAPSQRLLCHDINRLDELALGRFDLLFSLGTLHSPGIEQSKRLLMTLVQQHLTANGAVILGFPNCRWRGGEVVYGAKPPNTNHPELSLLFNDVDFCRRYLQQHRFRVTVTGKYYLVLTATRIGPPRSPR